MFRRIILEDWQRSLSIVGWVIFAVVFITSTLRAILLPKEQVRKLEGLPLEEESYE
jgi:uncharacterized membrane protein